MKMTQLKKMLLTKKVLNKKGIRFTETEINILTCIHLLNVNFKRCSCNILFKKLSTLNRTPYKKTLLKFVRELKENNMINILGIGISTNITLTASGYANLIMIEKKLRAERF